MSSPETHEIIVFLTTPQFRKYKQGKTFQLTNAQIQADNGKHKADLNLGTSDYKKLLKSIKQGKGYRFSDKVVKGGSLWGSFKKGVSSVGNFLKSNVNKEDVKNVIKKGVNMVAPDSVKDIANSAVDKVVDYGYDDSNKGKSLKEHAFSLANDLQPELKDAGLRAGKKLIDKVKDKIQTMAPDETSGSGIRDRVPLVTRPIKGSPEAREKMARLRAMRKKTKGSGFFDDIASGLIHTGLPTVGRLAGNFLGGPIAGEIGEQLGNFAGDKIGEATGRGLKNTTHTPYSQHVDGIPNPVVSKRSKESVKKQGYHPKQRGKNGLHISGGSFLQLGG